MGADIQAGSIAVDRARWQATNDGAVLTLTRTEFRLLCAFLQHSGRTLTRAELVAQAIGEDEVVSERTIDVHVSSLRRKLGAKKSLIRTIRGVGYQFVSPEAENK